MVFITLSFNFRLGEEDLTLLVNLTIFREINSNVFQFFFIRQFNKGNNYQLVILYFNARKIKNIARAIHPIQRLEY